MNGQVIVLMPHGMRLDRVQTFYSCQEMQESLQDLARQTSNEKVMLTIAAYPDSDINDLKNDTSISLSAAMHEWKSGIDITFVYIYIRFNHSTEGIECVSFL